MWSASIIRSPVLGSCIRFVTKENGLDWDCSNGISGGFCGKGEVEMLELNDAWSSGCFFKY